MSFAEDSSSFFDELTAIVDEAKANPEQEIDPVTQRPYSNLLTQDEEPIQDSNPFQAEETEPEVVTRATG